MDDLTINTADAVQGATLTVRMHTSGVFCARLWLATSLVWLAGWVIGMEVECELASRDA